MGVRKLLRNALALAVSFGLAIGEAPASLLAAEDTGDGNRESVVDLSDGLVGHWTFDGGSQDDAWLASSVTENLVAEKTDTGVSLSEDGGISGGAADFAGTANKCLTLKLKDANVGLTEATGSFSIGAWIKYRSISYTNETPTSVFHLDGDSAGQPILSISPNNSKNVYNTFLGGQLKYSSQEIAGNQWHHVMFVFDKTDTEKKARFYVNGVLAGEETITGNVIYGNGTRGGNIRVGYHRATQSSAVDGLMDEIRYYDKAVAADTVEAIYRDGGIKLEINTLKEDLRTLLTQAEALSGGDSESVANLTAAKEAAEALLGEGQAETEAFKTALQTAKNDLTAAIENYQQAGNEPDTVVPNGLVGYWTFEGDTETDRLASKGSVAGIAALKTGNGVTVQEGSGVSGGSASFSGNNASYLTLNLTEQYKLIASSNPFTIGAWIKYDDMEASGLSDISVFHQDGASAGRAILTIKNNGASGMRYGTYLAASNQYAEANIESGKWHHVMIAVDAAGEGRTAKIYVNGVLENENNSALGAALIDGTGNIRVGAHRQNAGSPAIKGVMDEIRYYNRTLSAAEVKTIYDVHGDLIETENVKRELRDLIADARALTGGTAAAQTELDRVIGETEALLSNEAATLTALTEKKEELLAAIRAYEASAPVSIAVDTSDELREIPSAMFGINHRYHNYGYGSWDKDNDKIYDAFNELAKNADFGSVRYPGGTVSNLFTWKDTIGPKEQRTTTIAGNNFYSAAGETPVDPAFGVDEAMKWIYDDLDSEAIFVYGFGRGNPQDAADLVEYLNAPNDGSNPNGGVDWAAARAENGHEEPYGVIRFELGNEFSDTGQNYWMAGLSEHNRGVTDLYIEGDRMTISGQTSYYQTNNRVAKKGDWRASASLSDGKANEERYVYYLPVVEDTAEVFVEGTKWEIVDSLEGQGAANVCTFDYETGKIAFGDGVNGAIPSSGTQITCNYKTDQSGFVDYYEAMKAVADEIGSEIEIYSGIFDGRQNEFIDKMHEKGYDAKYDGVIIHPYSNGVTSYEDSLVRAKGFSNNIATYRNKMLSLTQDDSKKVAVSEFGILSVSPASNYQTSLGHAIYIANHMIDCVNSGAAYQNKHCLVDTTGASDNLGAWQQCVIQSHQTDNGYQYVSTPSARLFSIFNNMTGSVEVNQTITGNGVFTGSGNNAVSNVNVYSTKDEYGNAYVMAVNNKSESASTVDITVDNTDFTGKEIEIWSLSSEEVTDMNTLSEPDKVTVDKTTVTGSGDHLTYTLLPHSVYSFKIPARKADVIVTAGENGTVTGGQTNVAPGEMVTVQAVPDTGYLFVGWFAGGSLISSEEEYTFRVPAGGITLEARFDRPTQVTVEAGEGGTAGESQSAAIGSQITVTARANAGYQFAGWYQGEQRVSTENPYTFTVESSITLTARFEKKKFAVKVEAQTGGVASGGNEEAEAGSEITVTATANEGYEFTGWYEGSEKKSTEAVYTFTVEKSVTLTAKFKRKQTAGETVTVQAVAEEGGTASGGKEAAVGSEITVTATADKGYEFVGWYEGSKKKSTEAVYTFTVEKAVTLTAKFRKKQTTGETVTVQAVAEEGGTASGGNEEAEVGSEITVTATAEEGYEFAGWDEGGTKISDENPYTFFVEKSIRLTAKFVKNDPAEKESASITVTAEKGGMVIGGNPSAKIGSKATVTAKVSSGYEFVGWYCNGKQVSKSAAYTFTVQEDIVLTAKFKRKKAQVTVNAIAGGTAVGGAKSIDIGSKITVTAKVNTGYEFAGWYQGNKKVSGLLSYTFTVTGNTTLTAKFQKKAIIPEETTFTKNKFKYQILDKEKSTVLLEKGLDKKAKQVVIPPTVDWNGKKYTVVKIGKEAFSKFSKLKKAVIGKNVTRIDKNAFSKCRKLENVIFKGTKIQKVEKKAFRQTSSKMTVKVPKSLKGKKRDKLLKKLKSSGMSKKAKIK